ncbi:MAG: DUF2577 domain-containing protein [Oscillospiraceae bacterium]|jgi:hypothetical protein|nr:DUF2577 domain-containing protein [Oscillospiraceae bacterium]
MQTSIKGLIQELAPTGAGVIAATVLSVNPLEVQGIADQKLLLSDVSLVVPRNLTDYTVTAEIAGAEQTVILKNGLAPGDTVYLLSMGSGSKYYILDRGI